MTKPPHILLIGNYLPDGGESMDLYAALLARHLPALGFKISFLLPRVVLGRFSCGSTTVAKYLGYVDKLVLFPFQLRRFLSRSAQTQPVDLVHVCDNCNALYVPTVRRHSPPPLILVTCHDFFALNGTLGLQPGMRPRLTGRMLHRLVLRGLRQADHMLCVSLTTAETLLRLPGCAQSKITTIPNALRDDIPTPTATEATTILHALHPAFLARPRGHVFHIGNNHWYKNRAFILEAYFESCRRSSNPPLLVFAGKKLDADLAARAARGPANAGVLDLGRVDDAQLAALYTNAGCLFFPSLAEGFGSPLLEAMACGCPVITSAQAPMAEITGDAALLVDPTNVGQAADALEKILRLSTEERSQLIAAGLSRAKHFSVQRMIGEAAQLYRTLLRPAADGPQGSAFAKASADRREPSTHA